MGRSAASRRNPTEGQYRNGRREIFKDGKWQPVNVVHSGQRATLNGREVIADGKGNWRLPPTAGEYQLGPIAGSYQQNTNRTPETSVVQPPVETPDTPDTPEVPESPGTGDSETRVSQTGVEQKGRNFGFKFPTRDEIESYAGRSVANPFSSNDLPTSSGFSAEDRDAFGGNPADSQTIAGGGQVITDINPDGTEETRQVQGSPSVSLDNPQFNPNNPRSEFLDADNTMGGLKASEAAQGLVFASGKYWVNNPNAGQDGQPELIEVRGSSAGGENRQAVRDYKAGKINPQDFFENYVADTTQQLADADTPTDDKEPDGPIMTGPDDEVIEPEEGEWDEEENAIVVR